jgi:hypothetical protein
VDRKLRYETGLADTRLAGNEHETAAPTHSIFEVRTKDRSLVLAARERRKFRRGGAASCRRVLNARLHP